jgi:hypothetical protein
MQMSHACVAKNYGYTWVSRSRQVVWPWTWVQMSHECWGTHGYLVYGGCGRHKGPSEWEFSFPDMFLMGTHTWMSRWWQVWSSQGTLKVRIVFSPYMFLNEEKKKQCCARLSGAMCRVMSAHDSANFLLLFALGHEKKKWECRKNEEKCKMVFFLLPEKGTGSWFRTMIDAVDSNACLLVEFAGLWPCVRTRCWISLRNNKQDCKEWFVSLFYFSHWHASLCENILLSMSPLRSLSLDVCPPRVHIFWWKGVQKRRGCFRWWHIQV